MVITYFQPFSSIILSFFFVCVCTSFITCVICIYIEYHFHFVKKALMIPILPESWLVKNIENAFGKSKW